MKTAVGICFRNLLQVRFLLLAAVFFFAVDGWGRCISGSWTVSSTAYTAGCQSNGSGRYCYYGSCSSDYVSGTIQCNDCDFCKNDIYRGGGSYTFADCGGCGFSTSGACGSLSLNSNLSKTCLTRCDNQCDADSIACVKAGNLWDSANCTCSNICQGLESKCIRAGGRFTGRALNLGGDRKDDIP